MLPDVLLSATPSSPADDDRDFDAENTPATGNPPLETTSARGTLISVTPPSREAPESSAYTLCLTRADGGTLRLLFADNIRIAEAQDGGISVYRSDTGKTTRYSSRGERSEVDGDATTDDADLALVNITDSAVRGGDRNTLIFNFADNATISGGTGHTRILLADGVAGNTIRINGNAVITGAALRQSAITLDGASNRVRFSDIHGCTLSLGDGGTEFEATLVRDTDITLGDGSNTLHLYALRGEGRLSLGHGDNRISIYELKDNAAVRAGDGRNSIDMDEVAGDAVLRAGHGCNTIHVYQLRDNARVVVGDGDNGITLYEAEDSAALRVGDGNNTIRLYEIEDHASVIAGNGHNSVQADTLRQYASIRCGHGANALCVRHMRNSATLEAGEGNNLAQVLAMWDTSALSLGSGDNFGFIGARHAKAAGRAVGGMLHVQRKRPDEQTLPLLFRTLIRRHGNRIRAGLPTAPATPRDSHFPYVAPPRWRTPVMAGLGPSPCPANDASSPNPCGPPFSQEEQGPGDA